METDDQKTMQEMVQLERTLLGLAVTRLTRLRVSVSQGISDDLVVRAQRYHPLVAGGTAAAAAFVMGGVAPVLPAQAAVIVAWAALVWLTQARGPRGFAHVVEAMCLGKGSTGGTLAVLEAPWIGPTGTVALGLSLGLQITLLAEILSGTSWSAAAATLILGQALGAMAGVHIRAAHVPARASGVEVHAFGATPDGYRLALASVFAMAALVVLSIGLTAAITGLLGAVVFGQVFREVFQRRIGGYTEACLGGIHEMAALGTTLGVAVWL